MKMYDTDDIKKINKYHEILNRDVLEYLYTKYSLYLVSEYNERNTKSILNDLSFSTYFTNLFSSPEMEYQKNNYYFFDTIMNKVINSDSRQYLMVGRDLHSEILGANRANIDTIWLNEDHLLDKSIHPTYEVKELQKIKTII